MIAVRPTLPITLVASASIDHSRLPIDWMLDVQCWMLDVPPTDVSAGGRA